MVIIIDVEISYDCRFGGTDGYSDEPRFLPEFRAERDGFRSTDQLRSPYRHLGIQRQYGALAATMRYAGCCSSEKNVPTS